MALHDQILSLREQWLSGHGNAVPESFQGVSKDRINEILSKIDLVHPDITDAVFALLDNELQSLFSNAPSGLRFCDGATTAQIGCHVGILQRGRGKLDREGRDYWLKPLWQIGAIEKIYFDSIHKQFVQGHPKAKSPNSAYKLSRSFISVLSAPDENRDSLLSEWITANAIRGRLFLQAQLAEESAKTVDTGHADLIKISIKHYVPNFLSDYEVLYVDDSDGDRISCVEAEKLKSAGLEILLHDAMPDVLLWNSTTDNLWVIEVVTSDGEVDLHKVNQINNLARRSGKTSVGFTTIYPTWKVAALRQHRYKNIAPETYIWIAEDPSKHFLVKTP